MKFKRLTAGAAAAALAVCMCTTAFAADGSESTTYENGSYTGTIHFHNGSNPANYSMCDSIFAHEADLTLTDDTAELTFYVAYPIPAFSSQGTDGTIKDVVLTYEENSYSAVSDITTKAEKSFDTTAALFGITAGDSLPTQALTVDLPRSAVDSFADGITTTAYVNVVMNSTQNFVIKVTDLQKTGGSDEGDTDSEESMNITADVAVPPSEPSYTVTVPESLAMGTLSTEADNSKSYDVNVKASDLDGVLSITAAGSGELANGSEKLAFANDFGTKTVTADTEEAGTTFTANISITADAVKAAAAGNYTGTTIFTISYAAN